MARLVGVWTVLVGCAGNNSGFDNLDWGPTSTEPPTELGEREPDTDIGDPAHEVWAFMQSHLHTTGFHACANDPVNPGPLPEGTCYTSEGIHAFLQEGLDADAQAMIISDHNNIDAWFDTAFAPLADAENTRYNTPLRGTEWSSLDGHMTLLFPRESVTTNAEAIARKWIFEPGNDGPVRSVQDYLDAIDAVHAEGGLAIINHPELLIHAFPESSLDADGVEVGIPPNPLNDLTGGIGQASIQSSKEARDFWQRRLVDGERLAGTAGADHHHGAGDIPGLEAPTFGHAVNLIRLDPTLPHEDDPDVAVGAAQATIDAESDRVIDAIKRGHVMIVEDKRAARVFLGADTDGDGRFHDARAGDCILPEDFDGTEVSVRLRVTNPSDAFGSDHYNFLVWSGTNDAREKFLVEVDYRTGFERRTDLYDIDPDDPFAIQLTIPFDPTSRDLIRVVLERDVFGPANDTEVVTNPIYLGDWGAECDGAAPLF